MTGQENKETTSKLITQNASTSENKILKDESLKKVENKNSDLKAQYRGLVSYQYSEQPFGTEQTFTQ